MHARHKHTYTCLAAYWSTNHSPKTTCCLLIAIHDMHTRDRLKQFGVLPEN